MSLSTTAAAGQWLSNHSVDIVNGIMIAKFISVFQVWAYDLVALRYISKYGAVTGMTDLTTAVQNFLGKLYYPIVYMFWMPSYLAGSEDLSLFADLLTLTLFNFAGDNIDPTNVFIKFMFLQLPTAVNIIQLISTLFNKRKVYSELFQSGSDFLSNLFAFNTAAKGFLLTLVYTLGPQLLADAVYFPGTL